MSNIVIINRGSRTYTLKPITRTEKVKLADGTEITKQVTVQERILPPGKSIETLDDTEAQFYLAYNDIADAAKVVPANANKIAEMQREIDRLTAANAKLVEKPAEKAPEPEPEQEARPSKKKGK